MSRIQKITFITEPKTQGTGAKSIVHTEQVVGFIQPNIFGHGAQALITLQTSVHQHAPPPIRTGVGKYSEDFVALGWVLPAFEWTKPWVELHVGHCRVGEGRAFKFELKDFTAGTTLGVQGAQTQRCGQAIPVRVYGNVLRHGISASSS
jgi:hypothetical protein